MQKTYHRFIVLLIVLIGAVFTINAQQTTTQPKPDAAGLIQEFNRWRTAIGIRPYQEDTRLSQSAQFHSDDMATRNYFSHDAISPIACNGTMVSSPAQRAACFNTLDRGEGIYKGRESADEATRGWISSYGHCLGVMNPTATHLGGGSNGDVWTFQFNGLNEPNPPIASDTFCGCTKGNNDEGHIQSCVEQFNNQYNGGTNPPVPPALPLQVNARIPSDVNRTLNNGSSGGQTFGIYGPGTLTIRVVPVNGNPSGIPIELADGKFERIAGETGTDSLTYEVKDRAEFAIWFNTRHLANGDTFYFEILWLDAYNQQQPTPQTPKPEATPEPQTTKEPEVTPEPETVVGQPASNSCSQDGTGADVMLDLINPHSYDVNLAWVDFECNEVPYDTILAGTTYLQPSGDGHGWILTNAQSSEVIRRFVASEHQPTVFAIPSDTLPDRKFDTQAGCQFTASTVDELRVAIENANNAQSCAITLNNNLIVTDAYRDTENAFPVITSDLRIIGNGFEIRRADDAPTFRLFNVDGRQNPNVYFDLSNITLSNGTHFDGSALLIDARDGGKAFVYVDNVNFNNNNNQGNGGALTTLSFNGGETTLAVLNSQFNNNAGAYGGAIYMGGFDGGDSTAIIFNTHFNNNIAHVDGGAVYNNGMGGNGHADMYLLDGYFNGNQSPSNSAVVNNGTRGGYAEIILMTEPSDYRINNAGGEGSAYVFFNSETFNAQEISCVEVLAGHVSACS